MVVQIHAANLREPRNTLAMEVKKSTKRVCGENTDSPLVEGHFRRKCPSTRGGKNRRKVQKGVRRMTVTRPVVKTVTLKKR